tara:strand:+ start:6596 stop:8179 length:1584 start_codon:yes stop_codon:yes gene_type:complete
MNICKYPNNVNAKNIKRKCEGNKKYNLCYGEGESFSNLKELEKHVKELESDARLSKDLSGVLTTGCWENKSNKPFLKDFKEIDEKNPIKCLTNGNKWVTGDGYILNKKENESKLEVDTGNKIRVECSPGYGGEPMIEIGGCNDYTEFKEGDDGNYQQFSLSGCDICDTVYGGNRMNKGDKSCYPQCGLSGTQFFDTSNSNKDLRFIDTKKEFNPGEKRAGYCCNDVEKAVSMKLIKGTEKSEGSNYLDCNVTVCEDGYILSENGKCCRKIQNSKDDIKYECSSSPEDTGPIDNEINYCKEGYYPMIDEGGLRSCRECNKLDNGIHGKAEVECDISGDNVKVKPDSEYKCQENGNIYYNEINHECVECPLNMEKNNDYDKDISGSNMCVCKPEFEQNGSCFQCSGEGVDYNEKYPVEGSKCKCDIIDDNLPENVLIGDCADKPLYNGETCNLTCRDGYTLNGEQPKCFENKLEMGSVTCKRSDINETSVGDDGVLLEDIVEGFSNAFSTNTKRLFLIFLLIILILNLC